MSLPKHLAIIMDGNGRWAQQRHRPRTYGHIKGTRNAKKIIQSCARKGISHLTLYAFSSENWLRPPMEVLLLMRLLKRYLKKELHNLMQENIKFNMIGDRRKLPPEVLETVLAVEKATENNSGLNLTFAVSYGSRQEITNAVRRIAEDVADGSQKLTEITESTICEYLETSSMPDPDFVIRTSGEFRLSNFLLWQAAYAEFYFSSVLWPNFTEEDLEKALLVYSSRDRRFGAVKPNESAHI